MLQLRWDYSQGDTGDNGRVQGSCYSGRPSSPTTAEQRQKNDHNSNLLAGFLLKNHIYAMFLSNFVFQRGGAPILLCATESTSSLAHRWFQCEKKTIHIKVFLFLCTNTIHTALKLSGLSHFDVNKPE